MTRTKIALASGVALLAVLDVAPACSAGVSGDLEAHKTGDLSNPAAVRGRADEPIVAACGAGISGGSADAGPPDIRRLPYLQQVTSRSAEVLFTTSSATPKTIHVTRPDGTPVVDVEAVPDEGGMAKDATQWRARVTGLEPSTLYCYDLEGEVGRTGFKTAPLPGEGAKVHFLVFGDSGTGGSDQYAVKDQMLTVPFDLILHTGDLAYGEGTLGQLERKHFEVYRDVLDRFPMFPVLGNHEYETRSGAPYLGVFSLPGNGGEEGRERWYSFDWGDVHFVALDTERMGATQARWLDRDLEENQLPWTVVYGHRPPYSNGHHGSSKTFRRVFGPILEKHDVPLVLSGHEHDYQRFAPIDGVTYIVTGGGGNQTREVGNSARTVFSEAVLHFLFVEVEGDRLTLHAIDGVGREFDSVAISRTP